MMAYDAFLDDYRTFIAALPGTVNLPQGYFQNWRGWDYYQILSHADFKPTDLVLDTGALHTFGALYWSRLVCRVHVTDNFSWYKRPEISRWMSVDDWCKALHANSDNLLIYDLDLQDIQYEDDSFDKILCISTIEHVHDDAAAMREMYRVLKPGGKLLLTTEYNATHSKPYAENDNSFYRVYDEAGLLTLLADYPVTALVIDAPREPFTTAFVCIEKAA